MKSVIRDIREFNIKDIINDNKIEVRYCDIKENGNILGNILTVNIRYKNTDFEKKIIRHELFHFFEEKNETATINIISESAARIFEEY